MATLREWIEDERNGEDVEAIVFGELQSNTYAEDDEKIFPDLLLGKIMTYEQASPYLDREFCSGYGSVSCHAIHVWTKSRVLFIGSYDGSSWMTYVPRNPCEEMPVYIGGG